MATQVLQPHIFKGRYIMPFATSTVWSLREPTFVGSICAVVETELPTLIEHDEDEKHFDAFNWQPCVESEATTPELSTSSSSTSSSQPGSPVGRTIAELDTIKICEADFTYNKFNWADDTEDDDFFAAPVEFATPKSDSSSSTNSNNKA